MYFHDMKKIVLLLALYIVCVKSSAQFTVRIIVNDMATKKNDDIYVAGDFNNWSPNTFVMKKEGDEWVLKVHLSAGKHLYKYVVDGKWIIDPANKLWEQNEHNTGNSVLWIED